MRIWLSLYAVIVTVALVFALLIDDPIGTIRRLSSSEVTEKFEGVTVTGRFISPPELHKLVPNAQVKADTTRPTEVVYLLAAVHPEFLRGRRILNLTAEIMVPHQIDGSSKVHLRGEGFTLVRLRLKKGITAQEHAELMQSFPTFRVVGAFVK